MTDEQKNTFIEFYKAGAAMPDYIPYKDETLDDICQSKFVYSRKYGDTPDESFLWLDGVNGTVDLVVFKVSEGITQTLDNVQIALIQRASGHWAFPGGFMDRQDTSPCMAAIRETREELGITIDEERIKPGMTCIVHDERNSHSKFIVSCVWYAKISKDTTLYAGDDAVNAKYFSLRDAFKLDLWASHTQILRTITLMAFPELVTEVAKITLHL